MRIGILYNEPSLPTDHPDYLSEAGVLESVQAFTDALAGAEREIVPLGTGNSAVALAQRLHAARLDVVVNFCEGFAGRPAGEPHVSGLLEMLGLPYTGCGPECQALVRDKARVKWLLLGAGLPTAQFAQVAPGQSPPREWCERLLVQGPLFVKPAAEDASLGIGPESVATNWGEVVARVEWVHRRYGVALVEQYVPGREFNIGVLALPEPRALPVAEVEFQVGPDLPWPILTYEGKWHDDSPASNATPIRCPAQIDSSLAERLQAIALQAFAATGCRDYARVDLRVTPDGQPLILEVNANPDAGPHAGVARALRVAGIDYADFARRVVETALSRRKDKLPGAAAGLSSRRQAASGDDRRVRDFQPADTSALLEILAACEMFRPDEIETAGEILTEVEAAGPHGHYQVLVAENAGQPVGWSCHGLVPLTDATYDMYWIAVHPRMQGKKIGRLLLAEIERRLKLAAARWVIAETSSTPIYDSTRAFYLATGFQIVGDVPDFYRPGDGRVTYGKRLDS